LLNDKLDGMLFQQILAQDKRRWLSGPRTFSIVRNLCAFVQTWKQADRYYFLGIDPVQRPLLTDGYASYKTQIYFDFRPLNDPTLRPIRAGTRFRRPRGAGNPFPKAGLV
jgi:hypothetical protein